MDVIGLYNHENFLCYQASVIQTIFHNSQLQTVLQDHHFSPRQIGGHAIQASVCTGNGCNACCTRSECALCPLARLYRIYRQPIGVQYPDTCNDLMREISQMFLATGTQRDQQDAAEFWDLLCQRVASHVGTGSEVSGALGQHTLRQYRKCLGPQCQSQTTQQDDPGFAISCTVKSGIEELDQFRDLPVQTIIHRVVGPEIVTARCDDPNCRRMGNPEYGLSKGVRTTYLLKTTHQLVLTINMFETLDDGSMNHFQWPLIVPSSLDLSDYLDPQVDGETMNNSTFRLSAVICHKGNLNQGHYKVVIQDSRGDWIEADDFSISLLSCRTQRDRF